MIEQPTTPTLEELALRIEVTQAMLQCIGGGLYSVMDVLGLDHDAACADLDDEWRKKHP